MEDTSPIMLFILFNNYGNMCHFHSENNGHSFLKWDRARKRGQQTWSAYQPWLSHTKAKDQEPLIACLTCKRTLTPLQQTPRLYPKCAVCSVLAKYQEHRAESCPPRSLDAGRGDTGKNQRDREDQHVGGTGRGLPRVLRMQKRAGQGARPEEDPWGGSAANLIRGKGGNPGRGNSVELGTHTMASRRPAGPAQSRRGPELSLR